MYACSKIKSGMCHRLYFRHVVRSDGVDELDSILLETVRADNFEVALELIETSPSLATKRLDSNGYTAVHYASQHGNLDAVQKILGLCDISDIEHLFKSSPTPADVAREHGNSELQEFLSAIFPVAAEGAAGFNRGKDSLSDDSNEQEQPHRESSPSPPSSPEVDAEFDITGLASQDRNSRSRGSGSENGGLDGAEGLSGLLGLFGMLHGALGGEFPLLGDMPNFAPHGGRPFPFPFMHGGGGAGRNHGETAVTRLHLACLAGDEAKVISLVNDDNLDINCKDFKGYTPLMCAAQEGHTNIVKFLVSRNECDVNRATNTGLTALHYATHSGHSDIVSILLQDGHCDCMAQDEDGTIALHTAALNGFTDIVELLAGQKNCNPMHCDNMGRTALHCACQEGYLVIVKLLIDEKGCDSNVEEHNGKLNSNTFCCCTGTCTCGAIFVSPAEYRYRGRRQGRSQLCVQSLST